MSGVGDSMRFKDLISLVESDLFRHTGSTDIRLFLRNLISNAGFKYSFWMRVTSYLHHHKFFRYSIYYVTAIILSHYRDKYSIDIPSGTAIECGLYIGHFGDIVVHENTVIGKNFSISQGVTIGQLNRGEHKGTPKIGDNVYIGPGAKVIGNVKIGNNVAVGANCVVTKDIPDNAVVVGVPGQVISYRGAEGYLLNPL
jgi:serine O-acetyltransferase